MDALGVITALEKTCELEAKLRQAIQDTHPLTTTLDWDFHAADREREALLAIRCAHGLGRATWGAAELNACRGDDGADCVSVRCCAHHFA